MPKKKHWFFSVKGKGGCPPAFATGVDGDLTVTGTSWVNLSSIPKASAGLVWQFDNLQIEQFAWLAIDVGTGTELVQIICKTSCDLMGSIVTTGGPIPSSSYNGWENNGSSVSGTTVSGYSYSASIVQNAGGAGGSGGAGTNGYGGGGIGGQSGGGGGSNNGPGVASSAPGGAGDSTQGAGGAGSPGSISETPSPIYAPGGPGGGSGGGGGRTWLHFHPGTTGKFPSPPANVYHNGSGGGGGGHKGGHGGYLFIYFCETITATTGRLFAFGDDGYDGGAAGPDDFGPFSGSGSAATGGGGGAGGSGGHIWLECAAHSQAVTVAGGAGGAGGGSGGAGGSTGNSGTFTHIPT